jgi:hypothetical protein
VDFNKKRIIPASHEKEKEKNVMRLKCVDNE